MKLSALAAVLTISIAVPLAAQTSVNSPPPVGPNIPIVLGEVTDVPANSTPSDPLPDALS